MGDFAMVKMGRNILPGMRLDEWLHDQYYQKNSCRCAIVCDDDGREARVLAMRSNSKNLLSLFRRLIRENPAAIFRIMENREHRPIVLAINEEKDYRTNKKGRQEDIRPFAGAW